MRNKVTFEIKKAKKQYYSDKIRESQGRSQSWKILKLLIPSKSSEPTHIGDDSQKLASKFNNHFANVANTHAFEDENTNRIPLGNQQK